MATLRIYLFGGLRVYLDGSPLPPFPTQKTRSLFAYLATFRHRQHPRDLVAATFWGDMPTSRARRNLNTTLWRLRRTIPAEYLSVEGDTVGFDAGRPYWLDVARFEAALERARGGPEGLRENQDAHGLAIDCLRQAVDLYRGDFLEGFYDDWCLVEAERLRSMYLQALGGLLAYHRTGGEYEKALAYARRLLAADPLREDIHQQAMELYELLGRRSEALLQYETCRQLLQKELGVTPMAETVALHEAIRRADGPLERALPLPSPPLPAPLPRTPFDDFGQVALVGREGERTWLASRIEEAGRGHGGTVLLSGEAGVGKSRLVQEALRCAAGQGWLVFQGVCHDVAEPLPFQGWLEALRAASPWSDPQNLASASPHWLAELTVLLPELREGFPELPSTTPLPPEERRGVLLQALLQFFLALARTHPCLVVIEDLHWADELTLDALHYLGTHLRHAPILLLGSVRQEEMSSSLCERVRSLEQQSAIQQIALPRLSFEDTVRLAGDMLGHASLDPSFCHRLHDETAGNPFFVIEAIKALFEEGMLVRHAAAEWEPPVTFSPSDSVDWPLPERIRQVVQRRLEKLSDRSRRLVELAAVLGRELEFDLLWQASGWEEESVLEATDELLRRQLLLEHDERLCFSHDKIQQVIYERTSHARRRWLHRRAGGALRRLAPERVEELAQHFYLGGQLEQALPYCLEAGERARVLYANRSAVTYFNWAVEAGQALEGPEGKRAHMVAHEGRGRVRELIGQFGDALSDYAVMRQMAAALDDEATLARAVRREAWVRGEYLGEWQRGLEGAEEACRLAQQAGSRREEAIALLDVGYFLCQRGEYTGAVGRLQAALALAHALGDIGARAAALQYMHDACRALGRYSDALAAAEEAIQLWARRGNRRGEAHMLLDLGGFYLDVGDLASAEAAIQRAQAILQEIGARSESIEVLLRSAALHHAHGWCQAGLDLLHQELEEAGSVTEARHRWVTILFQRGLLRWDVGQVGEALADLQAGLALAREVGWPMMTVRLLNGLGHFLRQLGGAERARNCHSQALSLSRQMAFRPGEVEARIGLGLACSAGEDLEEGRKHLIRAVRLARHLGRRWMAEALAALAEGCLVRSEIQPARALARRAAGLAGEMELRSLQVRALTLYGQTLVRLGRDREAGAAFRQALQAAGPRGCPMLRWLLLLNLANLMTGAGRGEAQELRARACSLLEQLSASLSDEPLRRAFLSLPAVAGLSGHDPALRQGQIRVRAARLGVPSGRPLGPDEQLPVLWTVDAGPVDATLLERQGRVALRHRRILRLLAEAYAQGGDPTEADLACALGVSTRTIRSDIAALRRAGHIIRTRGTRSAN